MSRSLQELLNYIDEKERVCPVPDKWSFLWEILPDKKRIGVGFDPPLPLILAAWWETTDEQKRERLRLHIEYANKKNVLDEVAEFLMSLQDDEWVYQGQV